MDNENKTINQALESKHSEDNAPFAKGRKFASIIIVVLFLIGFLQVLTGSRGVVTTEINDLYLGVDGTYGDPVFLELAAISDVQLVEPFDFGTCIEGEETKNTVSGTYSSDEYGPFTAHAYINEPCIVVHHSNGVLVFNCGSDSHTKKMYTQLVDANTK